MTRRLTQGNEAVFRGAVAAGANYYAGYPISPSTEILNIASGWAAEHPEFRFLQAEDEIASANAVIGASLAGAKSFTATSGPGFSLMQEAIGYAQKVGVPSVFVNVQRVGPATGMPTMPGQGDIMQVQLRQHRRLHAASPSTPTASRRRSGSASRPSTRPRSRAPGGHPVRHVRGAPQRGGRPGRAGRRGAGRGAHASRRSARHEPGHPRFFAGVLMYEHGPNAGRAGHRRRRRVPAPVLRGQASPSRGRRALRAATSTAGTSDATVLIVCYGIVSRASRRRCATSYALFRPIRIHPDAGRRAARRRATATSEVVWSRPTTASTPTWSSWPCTAR